MEERTRENLINTNVWTRGLYMVLFVIAYSVAEILLVFISVYQFIAALVTGGVNEPLLKFGKNLSIYVYEILEFQTFNTELRPFPFSPWPDDEPGGEEWTGESEFEDDADFEAEVVVEDSPEPEAAPKTEPQSNIRSV